MSVMTSPSLQVGTNFQSMRTLQPKHMPFTACQVALQLARLAGGAGWPCQSGSRAALEQGHQAFAAAARQVQARLCSHAGLECWRGCSISWSHQLTEP